VESGHNTLLKDNKMHYYTGTRKKGKCSVFCDGKPIDIRNDILNYATSFDWGYLGDPTRQLALALLAHEYNDDSTARRNHAIFCERFVSRIHVDRWTITSEDLRKTMEITE
jgi:hypothetical protein